MMTQLDKPPTRRGNRQDAAASAAIHADAVASAERKRRQDDLLDLALLETFPASDPISVMLIT